MTKARQQRLAEARVWYPAQNFNEDSHVVKAYRKQFHVDKTCAMRELCLLGLLPAKKQKSYEEQLAAKARKRAERRDTTEQETEQDENFFYIAGYTSGGAPYGLTWDEVDGSE